METSHVKIGRMNRFVRRSLFAFLSKLGVNGTPYKYGPKGFVVIKSGEMVNADDILKIRKAWEDSVK